MIGADELMAIADTVAEIAKPSATPEMVDIAARAGIDTRLWNALTDAGLTVAVADPDLDADGTSWSVAAEIAVACGQHAAVAPVAETQVAAWLLARCGVEVPAGPLSVSIADTTSDDGVLRRVPYGRIATAVVTTTPGSASVAVVRPAEIVAHGANLAGEPRDDIDIRASRHQGGVAEYPADPAATGGARTLLRLLRTAQMVGAAQACLDLTVAFTGQRQQFGRTLARFQAIQQQVAVMASEVALMWAALDGARAAVSTGERAAIDFAVNSGKSQAGIAGARVARIAHQVHGAIGTTREHRLWLATTRLWSWAGEDGSDRALCAQIGAQVLAAGAAQLWSTIVGPIRQRPEGKTS